MKKLISALSVFLLIGFPLHSHGETQPLDVLKNAVDGVISILEDPVYKDPSQKETQHEKIWHIIGQTFNFKEMARRTLANNWRNFAPQQQQEFSDVFSKFLGENYLNKIQAEFKGEKVIYLDQDMVTETKVVVMTKIIRGSVETPINYSMMLNGNDWKVYDVKVEGVSLLKNYRSQFNSILLKESPDQLIDRLRNKIGDQE